MEIDQIATTAENLPLVKVPGQPMRVLGMTRPRMTCALPPLATLPPEQWQEIDMGHFACPVMDQATSSACVGFGSKTLMERARLISGQSLPPSPFSEWGVYYLVNHGKDGGADPEEAAQALVDVGCPIEGNVDAGGVPAKLWLYPQLQRYAGIWEKAKRFKLASAFHFRNWNGLCTALSLGRNCGLGIPVKADFMRGQVNAEGVVPWTGKLLGYHWVEVHALRRSTTHGWIARIQNSWNKSWGIGGFAWIAEQHLDPSMSLGFAVEAQIDDPDSTDTDIPPITG